MTHVDNLRWVKVEDGLPDFGDEVLVRVDGHRGPAWRNSYALVAYRSQNFKGQHFWLEERHGDADPIVGVTHWARFDLPSA